MKRNKFNLSHYRLLSMDMGDIIPLTWYEAIPGDSIQQATSAFIRVSPLLSPVMHPVHVRIHHWFVPNRLIWEDFEDFITGGEDGLSTPVHPYRNCGTATQGSLLNHLGIPTDTIATSHPVSFLPFRAYSLIWNEFYRDQDLSSPATVSTASGADATTNASILPCCWEKDYFTTARPWTQKGAEVTIPLGDTAPIVPTGSLPSLYATNAGSFTLMRAASNQSVLMDHSSVLANEPLYWDDPELEADLTSATGVQISDLKLALALQRYEEARARYGSRYTEYLRYLGVRSSDSRLQRPEYLGGGRQVIQFSEVLQTAEGTDPVGAMKGHGISAMRTNRFRRYFEEHGIVMTLMSVIPKSIYGNGVPRKFLRTTKEDYYTHELAGIGDQELYNKEVYAAHASPNDVFGYQSRYAEYRSIQSGIAGEFTSALDHWHYSRIFTSDPALNSTFVHCTPTKRVNADTGSDCLYVMANHSIQARRPITR